MLSGGGGSMQIMMQAVGAAMRGERPEDFLSNLAKTNPQLKGLDLTNLESTANKLAQQKGVDMNQLTESVKASVNKLV
jgi:hypothetical protein